MLKRIALALIILTSPALAKKSKFKGDLLVYYNHNQVLSFLKSSGIDPNDWLYLLKPYQYERAQKYLKETGLRFTDIKDVTIFGQLEKEESIRAVVNFDRLPAKLPAFFKKHSNHKIKGVPVYKAPSDKNHYMVLVGKRLLIAEEKTLNASLPAGDTVIKLPQSARGQALYLNIDVSKFLKEKMQNMMAKGERMGKGLSANVFLQAMVKLKSFDMGISLQPLRFNAGLLAQDQINGERLMMVTHTVIVATSIGITVGQAFAMQRMKPGDRDKFATTQKQMEDIQKIFGRIRTRQRKAGVLISLVFTNKEKQKLVTTIKEQIGKGKKRINEAKHLEAMAQLVAAAQSKNLKKVIRLARGDLNVVVKRNYTPLTAAIKGGDRAIVRHLLRKGAKINMLDGYRRYPLLYSYSNKKTEIFRMLRQQNADLSVRTVGGQHLLHLAVKAQDAKLINELLGKGQNPDVTDGDGNTPLHDAARANDLATVNLLLKKNANKTKRNYGNKLPADLATDEGVKARLTK